MSKPLTPFQDVMLSVLVAAHPGPGLRTDQGGLTLGQRSVLRSLTRRGLASEVCGRVWASQRAADDDELRRINPRRFELVAKRLGINGEDVALTPDESWELGRVHVRVHMLVRNLCGPLRGSWEAS